MKKKKWTQIALWSHKIGFIHPIKEDFFTFTSIPNNEYPWNAFNIDNLSIFL